MHAVDTSHRPTRWRARALLLGLLVTIPLLAGCAESGWLACISGNQAACDQLLGPSRQVEVHLFRDFGFGVRPSTGQTKGATKAGHDALRGQTA